MHDMRYIENRAILQLDQDACIGCTMCSIVCPHRVFQIVDKKAQIIDRNGCMECGACAKNCPTAAIHVNPDDRCGCAALIIKGWLAKVTGKTSSSCSC